MQSQRAAPVVASMSHVQYCWLVSAALMNGVGAGSAEEYCRHLLRGAAKSVAVERPAKMDVEVVVQLAVAASIAIIIRLL